MKIKNFDRINNLTYKLVTIFALQQPGQRVSVLFKIESILNSTQVLTMGKKKRKEKENIN